MRKYPLVTGETYHVMNKSIAGYKIFTHQADYERFLCLMRFFNLAAPPTKFSLFLTRDSKVKNDGFETCLDELVQRKRQHTQIIAYCLMPTHFHVLARQLNKDGISIFLKHTLNSYARYFNIKHKRQGTLWMSRFQNRLIENDGQLLHVTRYIHLNPATARLVKKPEDWPWSSYQEYIARDDVEHPLTNYTGLIDSVGDKYRQLCKDQASYQRELAVIKEQIME